MMPTMAAVAPVVQAPYAQCQNPYNSMYLGAQHIGAAVACPVQTAGVVPVVKGSVSYAPPTALPVAQRVPAIPTAPLAPVATPVQAVPVALPEARSVVSSQCSSPKAELNERHVGAVVTFGHKRGFGFIDSPTATKKFGRHVFVHNSTMKKLCIGCIVEFSVTPADKGPLATDLKVLRHAPRPRPAKRTPGSATIPKDAQHGSWPCSSPSDSEQGASVEVDSIPDLVTDEYLEDLEVSSAL
eukprot:TRINITY_DN1265_c0_g1_i3.p1 TRINITY_DN1265_c0_g1~~TRINITY_DN1265_c0_g1_i3.p1  ORF type:complete len:241 (+),score=47.71 TRINITY_DN1265_c0_g1_i3:104-826(+)